jgi:hypothetical protein
VALHRELRKDPKIGEKMQGLKPEYPCGIGGVAIPSKTMKSKGMIEAGGKISGDLY